MVEESPFPTSPDQKPLSALGLVAVEVYRLACQPPMQWLIISQSMRLDAHQHFWHYSPSEHTWMTDQMQALRHDFLPQDLRPLLAGIHFDGSVAVQARQSLEETNWLLELAEKYDFIKGVVGWVDLRSEKLREQLNRFARHPKLVGVRHVVHDEPDDNFMLRPDFRGGIAQLREFDLTYDLLLFPKHLAIAAQLVEEFPEQPFVLDHIAKPSIAEQLFSPWQKDLLQLAKFPNVFCKLSGMVTEAQWKQWRPQDFHRYLDIVFAAFGWSRLMIGSDWPVCTLSGEYGVVMQIVMDYVQKYSLEAQAAMLGDTCARFYQIDSHKRGPR
jgi:L-fuconolactonase